MILFSIFVSMILVNNTINAQVKVDYADDVTKHFIGRSAFDQSLYEDVSEELCEKQLLYLSNNSLRWDFLDATAKLPSGLKVGNINDLGDYFQCLSINHVEEESELEIQGKYCAIGVPLIQTITIPELPQLPGWPFPVPNETLTMLDNFSRMKTLTLSISGLHTDIAKFSRNVAGNTYYPNMVRIVSPPYTDTSYFNKRDIDAMALAGSPCDVGARMDIQTTSATPAFIGTFGICVPKACSPRQAINFVQTSIPFVNLTFYESYCRLPGDKPFSRADYTALAIFSVIGILIIISTAYDLYQIFIFKQESSSPLYRSFSVYTNTRRFLTFNPNPGALECLDGIRSISMMWVIVGHVHSMTIMAKIHNTFDVLAWMRKFSIVWISSAPIAVDTFFLISGILVVYTTIGKTSRDRFIKSIHLFIINRLLRIFPLLATVVLLQASVVNHISDGPVWNNVAELTEHCRTYWWSALLHVQNYVNPIDICLAQTWYLSVDIQLYVICPLVIVFLFGTQRVAWSALSTFLIASLVSSSYYSFSYNFSAALVNPMRAAEIREYISKYYYNTLCRAPPFFIGMMYGYVIHQWRNRKIEMLRTHLGILWILSFGLMAFCIFSMYPVMQLDHNQQTFDNFLNAYMRAIWAVGLGWLIFACVKGYGGPINWFLSLRMWKLLARISFAMYLIHMSVIMVANGSWTKTYYFTEANALYKFTAEFIIAFLAAFVLSICIDAPCSTLQKLLLSGGAKKKPQVELPKVLEPDNVEVVHPSIQKLRKRDND